MQRSKTILRLMSPVLAMLFGYGPGNDALAHQGGTETSDCRVWTAARVFDGFTIHPNAGVLIQGNKVARVGPRHEILKLCGQSAGLGDATILPGFIESHAHVTFQKVPSDTVLRHGVTTVRDTGGPLLKPKGGQGKLRLLSAGPIIQAPGGYPLNVFGGTGGYDQIGIPVTSPENAREVVRSLVAGGAAVIKIALERGGEAGAPWSMDHGHGSPPPAPWALLSVEMVRAIVAEAHTLDRRVTAHVGEDEGVRISLEGGVDEWAHVPCAPIDGLLLQQAVNQGVNFVSTVDTLSSCTGVHFNAIRLGAMVKASNSGSEFIYGSEIAHDNVPWGINAQELHLLMHLTEASSLQVLQAATSRAGENLGMPLLGTLKPGAPADLIAVRGDASQKFKPLEYPDLVVSGGRVIVDHFKRK